MFGQFSPLALWFFFCIWHSLVKSGGKPSVIGSLPPLPVSPLPTPLNPQCMYTQAGTRRDSLDGCFSVSLVCKKKNKKKKKNLVAVSV